MTLDLETNEVQFILQVLGQLPTSSNVYPLVKKIESQIKETLEPINVGGTE